MLRRIGAASPLEGLVYGERHSLAFAGFFVPVACKPTDAAALFESIPQPDTQPTIIARPDWTKKPSLYQSDVKLLQ
jgi:hypothetical protein